MRLDLAVQQVSELKLVPGIEVVGPIPVELQQNPAVFSAGRMAASQKAEQADRLLKFLKSPDVTPALRNPDWSHKAGQRRAATPRGALEVIYQVSFATTASRFTVPLR